MAKYNPVNIAYKEFIPATGINENLPPLIFLHGLTGCKESWEDIPQILADKTNRKAYAIDARDHGDSPRTEEFNFDLNVDDLLHFMDTKNISKAVLIGQSMGGLTATNTALRSPDRVEMLFSEDMYIKKIPQEVLNSITALQKMLTQSMQSIPSNLTEEEALNFLIDSMIQNAPKEFAGLIKKDHLESLKTIFKKNSEGKYGLKANQDKIFEAIQNAETLMKDPSGHFDGPAYFLYGSISPFQVDKEEDHIKKHFPRAELIEFKDASHNVHGDCYEKYIDTILQRIQK